jgi:DNA-binding transcriptional LysR family regulator
MSVSPSAVSQQLAILESEAGMPLLQRVGRGVRLTEAGVALAEHAQRVTDSLLAAEVEMARRRGTISGILRVAAFPTAARAIMPTVMASLIHEYRNLRVELRDLERNESLAALELNDIDLAIVDEYDEPLAPHRNIETSEILEDPIFVAAAGEWSGIRSLADARDAPWIMDSEGSPFSAAVIRTCRQAGFAPAIRSSCKDFGVILALAEAGLGVAMMPGLALHGRSLDLGLHRVRSPQARRVLAAVHRERRADPAVRVTLERLANFGRNYQSKFEN